MHRKHIFPFFLIALILVACEEETTTLPPADRGELISVELRGTLTPAEIEARIDEFPSAGYAQSGVTYYSITYRTIYAGEPIDSRGLLIVPDGTDTVDLLMYCHGTQLPSETLGANDVTPSTYAGSTETHLDVRNMGLGWATKGFVVFMPDYIGFGATLGQDHPYVYYPEMFLSNIDGLLAVKEYLAEEGYAYDNQLFLTGWSQGGGASLSTHRFIQEQYADEFTVAASSNLAGPHHFERFHNDILSRGEEEIDVLPIISWAIYSVNKFSDLRRPTDQMYTYPVFDQMSSIFTPSKKPAEVFKPYFIEQVLDGTDTDYVDVLRANSFHANWQPTGKVFLHHGDADDIVPYYNSTDALAGLQAAGGDVVLYTYAGGKHDTDLGPFIQTTLTDFNPIR